MSNSQPSTKQTAASPSASGPAGALFEGQVGAHYLLTMLAEADPRGLPGVAVQRVELQRAGEGYPLDDVIVHGVTAAGDPAVLEVQVKRTATFAPADAVFKSVVEQLAHAFPRLDLSHERHQLAVAIERTSFKITGPYQDVLRWAREVGSASTFIDRIDRKNVGNDDMRTFVATVRMHLAAAGCSNDNDTVWQILRRFQILAFDYDAPGSQSHELALERARHVLQPNDASRCHAFWKALTETAIRTAASGGDLDQARLLAELGGVDGFRMLDARRNRPFRETLSQAASLAAADLQRNIAGVTLTRSTQLKSVREARDAGRYVEIRGGPGVGKSGLLGTLVQQVLTEARAIVLSPDRTIPGGWLAFKSALGIDTSPQAFLADLASDGGAVLFVDSLDFFDDTAKRATVVDLVQSAAEVPNFQVIVTARSDFDKEEPNWLPPDALARLGRAPPVIIKELAAEEIDELRTAAPALRALLADEHPARDIARNLFRLSRLLEMQGSTEDLRSEVDLLERWWMTADGLSDGRRQRARLLSDLSDAALAGRDYIEIRAAPTAVDALIANGTLRELGLDRLTFRHDVLRDWGVASRLHDDFAKLDHLQHHRPAPASMARGVELGARLALERSDDGQRWVSYVNRVSPVTAHASWRRWSLLAILRSEHSVLLLNRAAASLFDQDGALLRELIRTAIAVECRPLADLMSEIGADPASIPASIYGPTNDSWVKLVVWLLSRRADIPIQALPDVVDLFQSLSAAMFFTDPLTPQMGTALADWLEEIEIAQEHHPLADDQPRFAKAHQRHDLYKLADDVRHAFALMAARIPERAQRYIQGVLKRRNPEPIIREIMRFRGFLAHAAPAELMELTLAGLVPKPETKARLHRQSFREQIFTHLDTNFLPSSPAQGPFLELLNAAPQHGLALIRKLIDHAVAVLSHGQEPDDEGLTLVFLSGPRFFPWQQTYYWSRNANGCYAIESGLMALEAWSHARIERGDAADQVIGDILGPEGSPTAFLLVAVDILISHWPKTKHVAIPFLGSPEVLSLDRARQGHDAMPKIDLLGWGPIERKEPSGPARLADLKERLSRQIPLEFLLPNAALPDVASRDELHRLLQAASARLGDPEPDDTFAEPRLMARYALNLIDPANWQPSDDGLAYISPPEEAAHVANLQATSAPQMNDANIELAIQSVLENKERSSPELAVHAVAYAKRLESAADAPEDSLRSRTTAIVSAAMIAVRDGTDLFLDEHEGWVRRVFEKAFAAKEPNVGSSMREGIRFNSVAIAALGLIHLWQRRGKEADRDALLDIAGRDTAEAAQGFGSGLKIIRGLDRRVVPAALRCALAAQIKPTHRWNDPEEKKATDYVRYRERVATVIAAERAWLSGDAEEPPWPPLPPQAVYVKSSLRFEGEDAEPPQTRPNPGNDRIYVHSGALWVRQLTCGADPQDLECLTAFIVAYAEWTANANGAGFPPQAEIDDRLDEWNEIFYRLLTYSFVQILPEQAAAEVKRAVSVPDASFFDIATVLVRSIDELYFNGLGLDLDLTLRLRSLIAERLLDTTGWRRERDRSKLSVEIGIGPAIGIMLFNYYDCFNGARCYLKSKGIDQVEPFFPQLTRLIEDGPVPFSAQLTMNLLEVARRPDHTSFFLSSALTWLRRQPGNTQLWVDGGLGARMAKWLELVTTADASLRLATNPLRTQMDDVLAQLVQVGVPEAHRVEGLLANNGLV